MILWLLFTSQDSLHLQTEACWDPLFTPKENLLQTKTSLHNMTLSTCRLRPVKIFLRFFCKPKPLYIIISLIWLSLHLQSEKFLRFFCKPQSLNLTLCRLRHVEIPSYVYALSIICIICLYTHQKYFFANPNLQTEARWDPVWDPLVHIKRNYFANPNILIWLYADWGLLRSRLLPASAPCQGLCLCLSLCL